MTVVPTIAVNSAAQPIVPATNSEQARITHRVSICAQFNTIRTGREFGIAVYYYPYQQIKHQYAPFLLDTLHKCFQTGFNRYKLYQKHEFAADNGRSIAKTIVVHKIGMVLDALWRARQAESMIKVLFYLPFMLLFEAANKAGFLFGLLSGRSSARKSSQKRETNTDFCSK